VQLYYLLDCARDFLNMKAVEVMRGRVERKGEWRLGHKHPLT